MKILQENGRTEAGKRALEGRCLQQFQGLQELLQEKSQVVDRISYKESVPFKNDLHKFGIVDDAFRRFCEAEKKNPSTLLINSDVVLYVFH